MVHVTHMNSTVAIYLDSFLEVSLFGGLDTAYDAGGEDDEEHGHRAGYRDDLEIWEWTLAGLDKACLTKKCFQSTSSSNETRYRKQKLTLFRFVRYVQRAVFHSIAVVLGLDTVVALNAQEFFGCAGSICLQRRDKQISCQNQALKRFKACHSLLDAVIQFMSSLPSPMSKDLPIIILKKKNPTQKTHFRGQFSSSKGSL